MRSPAITSDIGTLRALLLMISAAGNQNYIRHFESGTDVGNTAQY